MCSILKTYIANCNCFVYAFKGIYLAFCGTSQKWEIPVRLLVGFQKSSVFADISFLLNQ
jgi:hypothetical protein